MFITTAPYTRDLFKTTVYGKQVTPADMMVNDYPTTKPYTAPCANDKIRVLPCLKFLGLVLLPFEQSPKKEVNNPLLLF